MQIDAIQQDVSTGVQEGAVFGDAGSGEAATGAETVLSPREVAMLEISQQLNEQQQAAGYGQPIGDAAAVEPDPQKLPEVLVGEQLAEVKVRVKVDGVEVDLPVSEVIKGYQKDSVASRRLAEAATERKSLEAKEQELLVREQALVKEIPLSPVVGDTDNQIKLAMTALAEGNEEEAAAALQAYIDQGRQQTTQAVIPPVIDEEAIVARTKAQIENDQAWSEFVASNTAFADVSSKQRQYGDYLFDSVYAPLIQSGEISYREALVKTAEEVNQIFTPEKPVMTVQQQKELRKQRIDNLPVAAGARAPSNNNPVPKTREETIEEMARMRGQRI